VPDEPHEARDEALVSFVRGTLPSAEAARITAEAAERPGLAAEIALLRGIAAAVDAEASTPAPGQFGWARLSRALDAEPRRHRPPVRRLWPFAASAAAAILIWQVLAVPFLARPAGDARYSPVTEQSAGDPTLSVAFTPVATDEAIRALLREIGARITDGPSAIGLWQLSFDGDASRDAGLARLQAAEIVESAQAN
jgi:hypothetical protein